MGLQSVVGGSEGKRLFSRKALPAAPAPRRSGPALLPAAPASRAATPPTQGAIPLEDALRDS